MKNIDIETLHTKCKKDIQIFTSLCGLKEIKQIILSCRLKPLYIFSSKIKPKIEYNWVDEFDKVLSFKNKKMIIENKSENIKTKTQISTDLFYGRSIIDTIKLSKSISLIDDFVYLKGFDEYFRCFNRNTLKQVSPLSIQLEDLIDVIRSPQLTSYKLPNIEIEKEIIKEMENINA